MLSRRGRRPAHSLMPPRISSSSASTSCVRRKNLALPFPEPRVEKAKPERGAPLRSLIARPGAIRSGHRWGAYMTATRFRIGLRTVCVGYVGALLLLSAPASARRVKTVEVGPIWNQMDADRKCPRAAREAGGTWTGQWRTTSAGHMSECDIIKEHEGWDHPGWGHHEADRRGGREKSVEVGPIWNQMDADRKCPEAARRVGGTWTGQWRTTRPGQSSECDIRR